MFKPETIEKARKDMLAEIRNLRNANDIKLAISYGNKKIGRVMNVSIAPLLSCLNGPCWSFCYDIKAVVQYANVRSARCRNYVLAVLYRDIYFNRIKKAISKRRKNKFFRWHVGGDMIDYDYFCRTVEIAREFPEFKFWTYTKKYHFVNKWISENGALPNNYKVMFSEWDGVELSNPYDQPTFSCKLKAGNKNHPAEYFESLYKCPGNCDICKAINRGCLAGEHTYADEH